MGQSENTFVSVASCLPRMHPGGAPSTECRPNGDALLLCLQASSLVLDGKSPTSEIFAGETGLRGIRFLTRYGAHRDPLVSAPRQHIRSCAFGSPGAPTLVLGANRFGSAVFDDRRRHGPLESANDRLPRGVHLRFVR